MIHSWELVTRMALAALLGGAVGLQREYVGKEAGFRTHALVSAGSALIMLVSIFIFEEYRTQSAQIDPSRIAAQVVSGIGFLGAGAIIRAGVSVIGLTTAACLWSCAAIGLACGVGFYEGAIYGTLIVLVILVVFQQIEILLIKRKKG